MTIIIWAVVAVRSETNLVKEESQQKGEGPPKGGLILSTVRQGRSFWVLMVHGQGVGQGRGTICF